MASRLQDVILRGTRAAQPAIATVAPGTLYYVTDELITERAADDLSAWETYADGGAFSAVNFSAGTTSNNLTNVVFSNSNGVTFGLAGSTITASHNGLSSQSSQIASANNGSFTFQSLSFSNANNVSFLTSVGPAIAASINTSLTNINFSAGTTSNNLSNLVFSNSNNISFGLDGSTVTASFSVTAGISNINVSAGTTSNNLSALVFSNSNNVSFGLNGSTITATISGGGAGAGGTLSYWENMPVFNSLVTVNLAGPRMLIAPMILQENLSPAVAIYGITNPSTNRTFGATSANTSFTASHVFTHGINLFIKGTGASSLSLLSTFSATFGSTLMTSITAGANGSQYTVSRGISFMNMGTTSSFTDSYACSSGSYVLNNANLSDFTQQTKFVGAQFTNSLTPGNYWFGIAYSSTSGTNGGAAFSTVISNIPVAQTQQNTVIGNIGVPATDSNWAQYGAGVFSTNTQFFTLSGFNLSQISTIASQPVLYFQFRNT